MVDNKSLMNTLSVCIIGEPNTGKSTLINNLLDKKISITSRKAQTTIKKKLGSLNYKNNQIIFYDTPGIFNKNHKLNRSMFMEASNAIFASDLVLLIISVKEKTHHNTKDIIKHIAFQDKDFFLVLNKIDLINKHNLLKKIVELSNVFNNKDVIPISAKKKTGFSTLLNFLINNFNFKKDKKLQTNPQDKDEEYITEIIREKVLENIHDEIPYKLYMKVDNFKIKKNNSIVVNVTIFLNKQSHKPIILGKNGQTIKKIGQASRIELEKIFKRKYHLYLFLKLRKNIKDKF